MKGIGSDRGDDRLAQWYNIVISRAAATAARPSVRGLLVRAMASRAWAPILQATAAVPVGPKQFNLLKEDRSKFHYSILFIESWKQFYL